MSANLDIVPASDTPANDVDPKTLPPWPLPAGVTSRFVETVGLTFHVLESVPSHTPDTRPPLILCVHGFPELAFSWRYILPLLAAKGYYAVAFDQRGYGRTHDPQLKPILGESFRPLCIIKDTITLVHALGYTSVACIVGHDFGAVTAAYCTLARPDFFRNLVLMSHPFDGVPPLPFNTSPHPSLPAAVPINPPDPYGPSHDRNIHDSLAALPTPRKHYKWYYCTRASNKEMTYPTGEPLHTFLRGYFHLKSADWPGNEPHTLSSWTATELEKMPHYYIMPRDVDMREAVAINMTSSETSPAAQAKWSRWLPDSDLAVYTAEWGRNSFQGGLNWYRIQTSRDAASDSQLLAGSKFLVPTKFVAGRADWGIYQEPGAVQAMETGRSVAEGMYRGTVVVEGAGHWVNQEQPERCVEEIIAMLE